MNIPYRTRRTLTQVGTVLLALLLILIVVWLCWVIWIERYVVYTRDGAELDLEISANDMIGEVAVPPVGNAEVPIYYNEGANAVELTNELTQLDGYYIDADALTNDIEGVREDIKRLSAGTPIMIDLKGGYGSFYYTSALPDAVQSASISSSAVDELITELKTRGFYLIGRVSAFRDYNYGLNHVLSGLPVKGKQYLWSDDGGYYWLDPTDTSALGWIASVVNEVKGLGFNEVVLADFRFPAGDKYSFSGDKEAALQAAANTLLSSCGSETFTLSFSVATPSFPLPEGRCRLYLSDVGAQNVGTQASQVTFEDPQIRLVFVTTLNDTRFNEYGVLRPISVSEEMEALKAERQAAAENTTPPAGNETPVTEGALG